MARKAIWSRHELDKGWPWGDRNGLGGVGGGSGSIVPRALHPFKENSALLISTFRLFSRLVDKREEVFVL